MQIVDKDFTLIKEVERPHLNKVKVTSSRISKRIGNKIAPKMFVATLPK